MRNLIRYIQMFFFATGAMFICCLHIKADSLKADYRYAPGEWQSTICLPDAPQKSLVNQDGILCLDHIGGYPWGSIREFNIQAKVIVDPNAKWVKQQMLSPKIPIVQTFRETEALEILEEAFSLTELSRIISSGKSEDVLRDDMILVQVTNKSQIPQTIAPKLIVDRRTSGEGNLSDHKLTIVANRFIQVNEFESIHSTHMPAKLEIEGHEGHNDAIMTLSELSIPPESSVSFAMIYHRSKESQFQPFTIDTIRKKREQSIDFWKNANLPWGCIQVPDSEIQALIDASIRNIWQSREIKNGLPAFQVGPTVYRDLWTVDGAFILETVTMLGEGKQARAGIQHLLSYQKPNGNFELNRAHWKENGIVIWACVRHAQLTQDKAWLLSVWPVLEKTFNAILNLRQQTYTNDTVLDDGLIPPGFPDGGLGSYDIPEYTNLYWTLAGMKTAVQGALWLNKIKQADSWQKEYDELYAAFCKAAKRDMLKDASGNFYLPNYMGKEGKEISPQRAQWAFCHAVYPGQVFAKTDPLVKGNLAMLEKTEREGMVYGTGWNDKGLWNYFSSFYGHAWLWQGCPPKAAESLYAFANHASPVYTWREEQNLKEDPYYRVGDMPHNWASAEFIRFVAHLLVLDRGNDLHLLEGIPPEWTKPCMKTSVHEMFTPFGKLSFTLEISNDGKEACFHSQPVLDDSCNNIVVHLGGWASKDSDATIVLTPNQPHQRILPISSVK